MSNRFEREANKPKRRAQKEAKRLAKVAAKAEAKVINRPDQPPRAEEPKAEEEQEPP